MIATKTEHSAIDDSATLAATLAAFGVKHLRTATAAEPLPIAPPTLIAALSKHKEPRLRVSLIPLFLRHPTYAQYVPLLAATQCRTIVVVRFNDNGHHTPSPTVR